jgi:uncharacterized protein (TIGR03083 family)
MEPSAIYSACRGRLLDLASSLSPETADASLAATPPWTVVDGYRHLAGVCSDVLDGNLEGGGSPPWTAAQLEARRGWSIDRVCAEWAGRGPDLDVRVAGAGGGMVFVCFDTWTHEQDIRAAAGLAGLRDDDAVPALAVLALTSFAPRYASSGAPSVSVDLDGASLTLGDGECDVYLRTSPYELMRIVFGRRSRRQIEAAGWTGDAGPVIDALHLFDLPERDIVD